VWTQKNRRAPLVQIFKIEIVKGEMARLSVLVLASLTGCAMADMHTRAHSRQPEPTLAPTRSANMPGPFGMPHPDKVKGVQLDPAMVLSEGEELDYAPQHAPQLPTAAAELAAAGRACGTELPAEEQASEEEESCAGAVQAAHNGAVAALEGAVTWPQRSREPPV